MSAHEVASNVAIMRRDPSPASPEKLIVDDSLLMLGGNKASFPRYLTELWQRRHFVKAEAKSKAFNSGRDTYLGKLWILLDPLLQVMVYVVVFGLVLNASRGMDNFVGFLIIGVIYFGFVSKGISSGIGLIRRSKSMINAFDFPTAAVVFSTVYKQFLDGLAPAVLAIVLPILLQLDKGFGPSVLLTIPLYLLLFIFVAGMIFIVARLTAVIPDTRAVVTLLNRLLFFTSGVFFTMERFKGHPTLQAVVELNPIYQLLNAFRTAIMESSSPSPDTWLYLTAWSFGTFFIGFVYFWGAEERYSSAK